MAPAQQLSSSELRSLYAGSALVLALGAFFGAVLWVRFGEFIYVDRILTAIAGCF